MAKTEPSAEVVCDAGPLILLEELHCLDLLADFKRISVPAAVWEEVNRHRPSALRHRRMKVTRVETTPEPSPELAVHVRAFSLAAGEAEALCLMQKAPEAIFLTDDAAARLAGMQFGYEVHGTLGVIVRALRRGQRTKRQVLNLLRAIPRKSTLFVTPDLLEAVMEEVQAAPR